jgi:hypothetical protein
MTVHIIDESKAITADFRHRALRHHAEGIFMLVIWTCKRGLIWRWPRWFRQSTGGAAVRGASSAAALIRTSGAITPT